MATGPFGRINYLLETVFPERQFYHRSHGEVRFISLSATNQLGLVLVLFAFLSWVAYASVNVVFKEQIISAKERNLIAMQQHYEVRLSEMQRGYDELNGLLTIAAERFSTKADELESYHDQLAAYVTKEDELNRKLSALRVQLKDSQIKPKSTNQSVVLMRAIDLEPTALVSRVPEAESDSELATLTGTLRTITGARSEVHRPAIRTTDKISDISLRVGEIGSEHERHMTLLEERTGRTIEELESFVGATGLEVPAILRKFEPRKSAPQVAEGGPLILIDPGFGTAKDGTDPLRRTQRLNDNLDRLEALQQALGTMPLALPVKNAVRMTSNFGPRVDPFTRRVAFHSGIDFGGPRGTPVRATQAGTVVYAGSQGAYGRLVEIDHGTGFRTRYAHLSRIKVKVGQRVDLGKQIGTIGSTGRSTGPHLHYEIWFDGRVRNPAKFIEAGQYVFEG